MRPPLEDPASILEPLAPGERVIWSGRPRGGVVARLLVNFPVEVTLVSALAACVALLAFGSWSSGQTRYSFFLPAFGAVLALQATLLALEAIAWTGRRYIVTHRRVAVVDPVIAYVFDIGDGLRRKGDRLEPATASAATVVARAGFPWNRLADAHAAEPALVGLADVERVLEEIERVRAEAS